MNIVVLNGSPSGRHGSTWWVLERFIEGMEKAGGKVATIGLSEKIIHHCTGELACWLKTPGKCIHRDDMDAILPIIETADAHVFATPVYVDGMTGLLKNCIDRMVPLADPHFELRAGHCRHLMCSGKKAKRIALVSVCGFHEMDNFDPLVMHVKAVCRNMGGEYWGALLRPAAPMFPHLPKIHPLQLKIHPISKAIYKAGMEFVQQEKISETTAGAVSADIISKEEYFKQVNKYFDKVVKDVK